PPTCAVNDSASVLTHLAYLLARHHELQAAPGSHQPSQNHDQALPADVARCRLLFVMGFVRLLHAPVDDNASVTVNRYRVKPLVTPIIALRPTLSHWPDYLGSGLPLRTNQTALLLLLLY